MRVAVFMCLMRHDRKNVTHQTQQIENKEGTERGTGVESMDPELLLLNIRLMYSLQRPAVGSEILALPEQERLRSQKDLDFPIATRHIAHTYL